MNELTLFQTLIFALAFVAFVVGMLRLVEGRGRVEPLIGTALALAFFAGLLPLMSSFPFLKSLLALALVGLGLGAGYGLDQHGAILPAARPRRWALILLGLAGAGFVLASYLFFASLTRGGLGHAGLALALILSLDMLAYGFWLLRGQVRVGQTLPLAVLGGLACAFALFALLLLFVPSLIAWLLLSAATLALGYGFLFGRGAEDLSATGLLMTASLGGAAAGLGLATASLGLVFFGGFFAVAALCLLGQELARRQLSWMAFLSRT